ncbi:MAG: tRNA 2-thiouridine(34) synthase MnmA [Lautropia sp.]|nr:tRNA 2-thiouridine(34) synthase MnmA [Lautropia sp.]
MKHTLPDGEGRQIVVGLSGGVDSAVSAWLLKEAGWKVTGLFMKNWEDDDDSEYCSTRQDWLDAASVADVIGIDLEAVNFAADYRDRVFRLFLQAYEAGLTPNPDILCNAEIKFKAFLDHALSMGAECIATGHYAGSRIAPDGRVQLLRGADSNKDQSYFLHRLSQHQLSRVVFPLANVLKPQVREIAARIGLPNATKKDSTGICFIGERPFREFLSRYLPTRPGPIVDEHGVQVGEHVGLSFYTLGQRKGIGIGGRRDNAGGKPWFVASKDLASNTLVVVRGHDHPRLLTRCLVARDVHWIGEEPDRGRHYGIKCRYRQMDAEGWIESGADTGEGRRSKREVRQHGAVSRIQIRFAEPQWGVTPGQSAVLYDGDICLGGAVIDQQTGER